MRISADQSSMIVTGWRSPDFEAITPKAYLVRLFIDILNLIVSLLSLALTMLIGYARVSTDDQNLDRQRDALHKAGCTEIYEDYLSGAKAARPGLQKALELATAGDILVVWRKRSRLLA